MVGAACGITLIRTLENPKPTGIHDLIRFVAIGIAALAAYKIIDTACRYAIPQRSAYFDSLLQVDMLFAEPLLTLTRTAKSIAGVYGTDFTTFGAPLWASTLVIGAGTISLLASLRNKDLGTKIIIIGCAVAVLLVPFALHPLAGGRLPTRSLVGVPIAMWVFAYIGTSRSQKLTTFLASLATCVLIFQSVVISNLYQASNYFVSKHDLALATVVMERIAHAPGFDASKRYSLAVFGSQPFDSNYPQPWSSTVGRSFFEWDGGNTRRISLYLHLLGFPYMKAVTPEQKIKVVNDLAKMPIFPSPGSIVIRNDVVLFRLGKLPNSDMLAALRRASVFDR